MSRARFAASSITAACALAVAACSGGNGNTSSGSFTGGTGGKSISSGTGGAGSGILFDAGSDGAGGSAGTGGAPPKYLIYASTDTDLFTLDPQDPALTLTHLGTFDCIGPSGTPNQQSTAMTDLAVDSNQNLWGLSSYGVRQLTVQGTTVHCGTKILVHVTDPHPTNPSFPFIKFEALTFAPKGVIKPGQEILVAGDTAGELWAIDTSSSPPSITQHGSFGTVPADDGRGHAYKYPGGLWELSGDLVFLANNDKPVGFATVRDCPNPPDNSGCNPIDTLMEIDMTALAQAGTQSVKKGIRGQVVQRAACGGNGKYGFGSMYGIASWNDRVYGFSRSGNLVDISNIDGTACLVSTYASDLFSGAAVTTLAPVLPPPPLK